MRVNIISNIHCCGRYGPILNRRHHAPRGFPCYKTYSLRTWKPSSRHELEIERYALYLKINRGITPLDYWKIVRVYVIRIFGRNGQYVSGAAGFLAVVVGGIRRTSRSELRWARSTSDVTEWTYSQKLDTSSRIKKTPRSASGNTITPP